MHIEKYNKSGLGNLLAHYERKDNKYRKYKNENINKEKTYLNYNLAPTREEGLYNFIKNRVNELNIIKRANAVWCCDWCLSAPKDIIGDYGKCKDFFQTAYTFLSERYGEENVVSCFCHYDEGLATEESKDLLFNSAHAHFCFIPVCSIQENVFNQETGVLSFIKKEKVSAKELINRTELSIIHNQLQEYLDSKLSFSVDILNGATKNGNLTVEQLKHKTKLENETLKCEQQLETLKTQIQTITNNFIIISEKAGYLHRKIRETSELHDSKLAEACSQITNIIDSYNVSLDEMKHQLEIRDNTLHTIETNYESMLTLSEELKNTASELKELEDRITSKVVEKKIESSNDLEL